MSGLLTDPRKHFEQIGKFLEPYLLSPTYQRVARSVFSRRGAAVSAAGIAAIAASLFLGRDERDQTIADLRSSLGATEKLLGAMAEEMGTGHLLLKLSDERLRETENRLQTAEK